jgi:hypothetical protein
MGQKTHPVGFRLGISKDWNSRYYAGRELPALLREDELLRKYLKARLGHAAIANIVIERKPGKVVLTARAVGGQRWDVVAAHWTFSDGSTAEGRSVTRPAGSGEATVTIVDGAGNTATLAVAIA